MNHEILRDGVLKDVVRVEAIDYENEGVAYITLFIGPNAWSRAEAYVAFVKASE